MERLVGVLRREVEALQSIVRRATVLSMLLVAGEDRLLVAAADDLAAASTDLGELEALRAVVSADAADAVGLHPDTPLRHLADHAGAAHGHVLRGLGAQLAELIREVDGIVRASDEVGQAALSDLGVTLERLDATSRRAEQAVATIVDVTRGASDRG